MCTAHTAAPSDVGEAGNEQKEEPAKADVKDVFQSNGTQKHGKEYVELEMYNNESSDVEVYQMAMEDEISKPSKFKYLWVEARGRTTYGPA
ncbi:hypothetical protein C0989_002417 [Termitomyces sp. Mn162]|nr:hypothetical protein C0989_002417 [Termitomyces sp. Mn162]